MNRSTALGSYQQLTLLNNTQYTRTQAGALPIPAVQWTYTFSPLLLIISFKVFAPSNSLDVKCSSLKS